MELCIVASGWLKSYKWNMVPHTVYEIRREMRVRESKHTVMLFDKKYFDVESQKYIMDKLPTIESHSLADFIDNSIHNNFHHGYIQPRHSEAYEEEQYSRIFNFPKFVPKDDDFDEICRRDEENKKYHQEMCRKQQVEAQKLMEEYSRKKREAEQKMIDEIKYQKQVKEAEIRSSGLFCTNIDSPKKLPSMSNIRPNCWIPKK